ncbi:MAG: hypothetical protein ACOX69_06875 [Coriobacteriales bacterium]
MAYELEKTIQKRTTEVIERFLESRGYEILKRLAGFYLEEEDFSISNTHT